MTEPSLIEAMARAMHDAMARRDGYNPQPDWYDTAAAMPLTGPGFVALWEGHARAALRAQVEHGPTPKMMRAMLTELSDSTVKDPKAAAWDAMRAHGAALRAELGEGA